MKTPSISCFTKYTQIDQIWRFVPKIINLCQLGCFLSCIYQKLQLKVASWTRKYIDSHGWKTQRLEIIRYSCLCSSMVSYELLLLSMLCWLWWCFCTKTNSLPTWGMAIYHNWVTHLHFHVQGESESVSPYLIFLDKSLRFPLTVLWHGNLRVMIG